MVPACSGTTSDFGTTAWYSSFVPKVRYLYSIFSKSNSEGILTCILYWLLLSEAALFCFTLPTVAANVVTDESAMIITRARNSARNLFKYPFFFIMSHSFLWICRFILTESGIIFGCMIDSIWFLNIFYHFSSFSNSFIFRKSYKNERFPMAFLAFFKSFS